MKVEDVLGGETREFAGRIYLQSHYVDQFAFYIRFGHYNTQSEEVRSIEERTNRYMADGRFVYSSEGNTFWVCTSIELTRLYSHINARFQSSKLKDGVVDKDQIPPSLEFIPISFPPGPADDSLVSLARACRAPADTTSSFEQRVNDLGGISIVADMIKKNGQLKSQLHFQDREITSARAHAAQPEETLEETRGLLYDFQNSVTENYDGVKDCFVYREKLIKLVDQKNRENEALRLENASLKDMINQLIASFRNSLQSVVVFVSDKA